MALMKKHLKRAHRTVKKGGGIAMGYEANGGKDHKGRWGAVLDQLAKDVADLKKKVK